ncbi:MAG: UDP-N-acetylmuramoylalanine--D-glutamate ligase [Bacillota bacterium]|nr:UDP-N-acetylmuramoylalanine--D-glutamate ligase [Bacillota bacterium]
MGKRVLVMGLARSGTAAAEVLARQGVQVVGTDARPEIAFTPEVQRLSDLGVELVLGEHPLSLLQGVDLIVVSPGVPDTIPLLAEAERRHLPVIGEVELAGRIYQGPYLAITGSNGKTTTTTWVGLALRESGLPSIVAGNIGVPLSRAVAGLAPGTWVVAEVSSFQLARTQRFRPHISAVLNLSEDHLDRHGSFAAYRAAKARVFASQGPDDYLILNADDEPTRSLAGLAQSKVLFFSRRQVLKEGAWVEEGRLVLGWQGEREPLCRVEEVGIPGAHNLENALATALLARAAGAQVAAIVHALKSFSGVEHRCEYVATIDGVRYVNDSKGTNPDAAIRALEAFPPPIVLIAGGRDKGTDLTGLVEVVKARCRAVVLLGEAVPKFRQALRAGGFTAVHEVDSLTAAVRLAHTLARPGDTVLLSPACASFDMFANYEERGHAFKEAVAELGRGQA